MDTTAAEAVARRAAVWSAMLVHFKNFECPPVFGDRTSDPLAPHATLERPYLRSAGTDTE